MLHHLAEVPVPIVAAINGPAIGAGTQLALASDLRVADETSKFGVPMARNGMAVDAWTVRTLEKLAGGAAARRMLIAGEIISCAATVAAGMIERTGTLETALAWAYQIADVLNSFGDWGWVHVNLIPLNPIQRQPKVDEVVYTRSREEDMREFLRRLEAKGIPTIMRDTRGSDIDAACGQLAATEDE